MRNDRNRIPISHGGNSLRLHDILNYFASNQGIDAIKTLEVIRKTVAYMENDIYGISATHSLSEAIVAECTNKEDLCAYWAAIGGMYLLWNAVTKPSSSSSRHTVTIFFIIYLQSAKRTNPI